MPENYWLLVLCGFGSVVLCFGIVLMIVKDYKNDLRKQLRKQQTREAAIKIIHNDGLQGLHNAQFQSGEKRREDENYLKQINDFTDGKI